MTIDLILFALFVAGLIWLSGYWVGLRDADRSRSISDDDRWLR